MSSRTTFLRQLEAYVQEEIGAQNRMLVLLETQESALRTHAPERMLAATQALDGELATLPQRTERRSAIVAALASTWEVAATALTLSSIVRRSGDEGERLGRQRGELERVSKRVQKLARRNSLAARVHQRLTAEILQAVLVQDGDAQVEQGGAIVDAEA